MVPFNDLPVRKVYVNYNYYRNGSEMAMGELILWSGWLGEFTDLVSFISESDVQFLF